MRYAVIGTAGHIDHGKTALVKALTGQDADRLPEERARHITIDLGFAWCDLTPQEDGKASLPDGQTPCEKDPSGEVIRVGFVDVPGHEKLIANMVSGVTGMDMVLFTVAADEGMMPQSIEHLDILDMLGVKRGIIVITKADLIEREHERELTRSIREYAAGTFLADAPVITVSAITGEGIPALRGEMYRMLSEQMQTSRKISESDGPARVPVDRVFTVKGHGTVVTGTLLGGRLHKGDSICLYPRSIPCKIRSIQSFGEEIDSAGAGQRCALNLPGIGVDKIVRGDVAAVSGAVRVTRLMGVRMRAGGHFTRALTHGMRAHLLIGTARVICKVFIFKDSKHSLRKNDNSLSAGECAYAQLRLEEPVAALEGERFILRFFSPLETIGGGVVLDAQMHKCRRNDEKACADLTRRYRRIQKGLPVTDEEKKVPSTEPERKGPADIPEPFKKPAEVLMNAFEEAHFNFVSVNSLDLSHFAEQRVQRTLKFLEKSGRIVRLDEYHYTLMQTAREAVRVMTDYFKEHEILQTGELRDLLGASRTSARVLLTCTDRKKITAQAGGASAHRLLQDSEHTW